MLIPDWILNLVLILITIRLLIWAFVFYHWLPVWYEGNTGIIRFLKKIGRLVIGGLGFVIAGSMANSLIQPLLMPSGHTVVKVEGQEYFSMSHSQQFFSPGFTFANGEKIEIPETTDDELVLVNNSPQSMVLWGAIVQEDITEQKRLGVIAPYSVSMIPDEITCLVPGTNLSGCIAENSSSYETSYHLSY